MCGIAGAIAPPSSNVTQETIGRMLDRLAHRGPDGHGIVEYATAQGNRVLLGHRRLAIIDPEGGKQPMCDAAAGLAITFNGEIYNFRELRDQLEACGYRFAVHSDTEVLLRAYQHWGERVVERLRGMFAFAIWDSRAERLFLARDRFGEKPLFLCEVNGGLYFASEIKALLELPFAKPGVDLSAVWDFLAYRYVPGPKTLFEGVRKLPPGTCAVWEKGKLTERRYWSPPDGQARGTRREARGEGEMVDEFLSRLDDSVKTQMVSDVPFGAFLSGGLDSSTIVALMTRHNSQVKTFSVGFGEGGYSELAYANVVARHFGTRHHELTVGFDDIVANLPKLVGFRDAPVSEPSDIPIYMLAKEASKSVKMVLTGEGSDEILGGYPKHVFERFAPGWQLLPGYVRHSLIAPLTQSLPYGFRRAKTAVANLNIEDWRERYVRWFGALDHRERDKLSVLRMNGKVVETDVPPFDASPDSTMLRRILYFDQTSWLPDNLLERGDRMTMAASIESRVPFLDHELAGFVSTLPDNCRVKGLKTKWILREAGRSLIPDAILERKKVGFRVPVNQWFQGPLKEYLCDHLKGSESKTRAYYDPQVLDRMLDDHLDGRQNHEKLLWALLNLEIWHRQYA
ncbi:MAG TPA: asparagine synthase (glutamine-hydrolyzing) [Usitatibacter sp.]|nr:asparagine synthase (glutamine-hydrolyzing) [Usitatibacter sp.]